MGVTVQDAPSGFDLTQDTGWVVQSHVQSNRGVETGEIHLTEVDRGAVSRPFPTSVTIAATGQGRLTTKLSGDRVRLVAV
ncbi:hypothetical protein FM21_20715 [Streptomyces mutabilis]|uniref:Uncharacterized protein n=1 Tax=Streptomyces mutabilis TaxID=67332 RepID=A0A086MWI0_9ACTN|nr:hypothetical protein FM21_20715 [Streptomyces mutabilis]